MNNIVLFCLTVLLHCSNVPTALSDQSEGQIKARAGENFTIILPSNIGTGYSWQLEQAFDTTLLQLAGREYLENEALEDGMPGVDRFTFSALQSGKTTLTFVYRQPWVDPIPEDARRKTYQVLIE